MDPEKGCWIQVRLNLELTYGAQTSGPSGSRVPLGWSTYGHGKQAFAGYFGRINYDYKGKYLLELNGRYDGSSHFLRRIAGHFFLRLPSGTASVKKNSWISARRYYQI